MTFNEEFDRVTLNIEEALDELSIDLDYERAEGVLTIICEHNGSQIILSRQSAVQQIWLAAKSGGFHFNKKDVTWVCSTTGESLLQLLNRVLNEQAEAAVELSVQGLS